MFISFLQHYSSYPYRHPCIILFTTRRGNRIYICRLTFLQERPHHVFALAKKKYHQSASALHPSSAPLLIYYVMIFFGSRLGLKSGCYTVVRLSKIIVLISFLQHYPSHPHRHPRQISLTIRVGNRVHASSHSFKNAPSTPPPRTRTNTTNLPVLYTLVRL